MVEARREAACPICGRPRVEACRPFCSARCADIDLGNWLSGRYAIPTEDGPSGATGSEADGAEIEDR